MKIENKFSNLWAEIDKITGWVTLYCDDDTISLGKYPNARFDILEELLDVLKQKSQ